MTAPLTREELQRLRRALSAEFRLDAPWAELKFEEALELLRGYEAWRDGIEKIEERLVEIRPEHGPRCDRCGQEIPQRHC